MSELQGKRYNEGKNRLDLIPPFSIQEIGKVFTKGAEKYGDNNYRSGMAWSKCVASLKRHLLAFELGEDFDQESELYHMSHVATNAMFLLEYYKIAPKFDDRLIHTMPKPRIGLDIDEVIVCWVEDWCKLHDIPIPSSWNFQWDIRKIFEDMSLDCKLDDFYLNLQPKEKAEDMPFEPVCYISHRPVSVEITKKWLQKHGFPLKPVFHVKDRLDKIKVVQEQKLDIYIDDSYETYEAMNRAGVCCYLMDAKHNQRYNVGYRRLKSLKELA